MAASRIRKPEPPSIVLAEPKALTRYQMRWVAAPWYGSDGIRKIHAWVKARQIGGSEAGAIRALCFCLGRRLLWETGDPSEDGTYAQETPMKGIVVSSTWNKAKEFLAKIAENVREWAEAGDADCMAAVPHCYDTKIYFPTTGTEVKAVACSPTAVRGSTGFVVFDEFSFARSQEELWGAGRSVTDPNLRLKSGCPMMLISTAWEAGSFAHRLFTDPELPFAADRFQTDIYQAVADGFPIDIDKAFAEAAIDEIIDTEYKCRWSRGGESFFSLDKLRACTVDDPDPGKDYQDPDDESLSGLPLLTYRAPCRVGIDCGGGVGRDFTAAVMWRLVDGRWWLTGIRASNVIGTVDMAELVGDWILDKNVVDPAVQVDIRCDRGVMGQDFIRALQKKLKERSRVNVIGVGMSNPEQETYALAGRKLLERGQMRVYLGEDAGGDRGGAHATMLELGRIKAKRGQGGHITFSTPRDPLKGHCDRGWAALIGLEGAELASERALSDAQRQAVFGDDGDSPWGPSLADSRGFG